MVTPDVLPHDHFSSSSPFTPTKGDALEKKVEYLKSLNGRLFGMRPILDLRGSRLKYSRIRKWSVGLSCGKDRIAVIRASGSIGPVGIIAEQFIKTISKVRGIRRLSSELIALGFDGLASDLMWREIKLLAESKPVVASLVDMAGSGGYQMAMSANAIVSENLTLTGSIGVVSFKFNMEKLYEKIGCNEEVVSKGRYAELYTDVRPFRPDEEKLFVEQAQYMY
ncbi:putative peptidase S49, ClpP/crotonase-like domain superfamily [Helianthus annuus]|nr:putative peptidase S49, ClpP/crotonase-like domain superfamily [Helianthus annuus]